MIETAAVCDIRPVTPADAALLLKWVNSPDSLQWKRETRSAIAAAEHQAWLAKRLADSDTSMWIVESNKQPVGQVRLQRDGDAFMIDVYVEAAHRKGGMAAAAIDAAIRNFHSAGYDAGIVADVHRDNLPSRRLFERLGFDLSGEIGDWLRYQMSMKAGRP